MTTITFLGAAREVTGSRYLISHNDQHVLIDCGMEQGIDSFVNQPLPVPASQVDAVILTHAHIDHSGMLPALVKEGFSGPIFATEGTTRLCAIMLMDSAHIQEMEAEWKNRKASRAEEDPVEPVYDSEDVAKTLPLFRSLPYDKTETILPGLTLSFQDAGHLLGSAYAYVSWTNDEGIEKAVLFSGDIGNPNQPILRDPQQPRQADVVVMESTYGDRNHGDQPDYVADLVDCLQKTFDRGGHVVIPSFAVGRTQELLYFLREIKEQRLVKGHEDFTVYMDSPLAIEATRVFEGAPLALFDEDMAKLMRSGINPLAFPGLVPCQTAEESKQINFDRKPGLILSASGMAEAGRVRHHLKHNLWRPESTILFAGYQAVGTLGRAIVDGAKSVKLFQETVAVRAQVRQLKAISGHADHDTLLWWVGSVTPKPAQVFVTHGEEEVALSFAGELAEKGFEARVPYNGETWDLDKMVLTQEGNKQRIEAKADLMKAKAGGVDGRLGAALKRLNNYVQSQDGLANRLKDELAEEINALIERWKR